RGRVDAHRWGGRHRRARGPAGCLRGGGARPRRTPGGSLRHCSRRGQTRALRGDRLLRGRVARPLGPRARHAAGARRLRPFPAPTVTTTGPGPGWFADPAGSGGQRYFDGTNWTEHVMPPPPPPPPATPPPIPPYPAYGAGAPPAYGAGAPPGYVAWNPPWKGAELAGPNRAPPPSPRPADDSS